MDINHLEELAALEAAGALGEPEHGEFSRMVADAELVIGTVRQFRESAAALTLTIPIQRPPATIKDQLFQQIFSEKPEVSLISASENPIAPFSYIHSESEEGWHQGTRSGV